MAVYLKGKKEILDYIDFNGKIDIKSVSLSTIEYLLLIEQLAVHEIADLFSTTSNEVEMIIQRNGLNALH